MKTTFFNRHQSMNSETRKRIMNLISDLEITENCPTQNVINMLYGSFDGYDYSERIKIDPMIQSLHDGCNGHLVNELLDITFVIKNYPRTTEPNGNIF